MCAVCGLIYENTCIFTRISKIYHCSRFLDWFDLKIMGAFSLPHTDTWCPILLNIAPHFTTLHQTVPYCPKLPHDLILTTLPYTSRSWPTLLLSIPQCPTLPHASTHYPILPPTVPHYPALPQAALRRLTLPHSTHFIFPHYPTLSYRAPHWIMLF